MKDFRDFGYNDGDDVYYKLPNYREKEGMKALKKLIYEPLQLI